MGRAGVSESNPWCQQGDWLTMGSIGNLLRRWDWFPWYLLVETPVRSKGSEFWLGLRQQSLALMLACPHGPPSLCLQEERRLLPNKCDVFHTFRYKTPRQVWEKAGESAQEVELRKKEAEGEKLLFSHCILQLGCVLSIPSLFPPCFFSSYPNPANVP